MSEKQVDIEKRAKAAEDKKASFGEDIDLNKYELETVENSTKDLTEESKKKIGQTGIVFDSKEDLTKRAATFIQVDANPMHFDSDQEGVEILSTQEALAKYDWLHDMLWTAVQPDADKYTAHVALNQFNGYFVRVAPGVKAAYPLQACLHLARGNSVQDIHNIMIAEEGAELHLITGCSAATQESGVHLGVTEMFIRKGANVTNTMIHSWADSTDVRPRTGVLMDEDSVYVSNYILLKPVKSVQMNPAVYMNGKNAIARFNTVAVALPGSNIDLGSKAYLNAPDTKVEILSRTISMGGNVISRGYLEGNAVDCQGHLECSGLMITNEGCIHAIPELKGNVPGIKLSHEAAVGKIAEEELEYLMSRGLTRDEATSAIIRGFIKIDIEGLPKELTDEINKAIEQCADAL